jgi:Raf kinase inhibitor-like YbhB/YbcL family protein
MRKGLVVLIGWLLLIPLHELAKASSTSQTFTLKSNEVMNQGTLPAKYTCHGKDVSPELHWTNAPQKTASFALILHDPDAPSGIFYHWVVYNIPPTVNELTEAQQELPAEAVSATTSWGSTGYRGACPPQGQIHRYIFTLYALDTKLELTNQGHAQAILHAMQGHILAKATLIATYGH